MMERDGIFLAGVFILMLVFFVPVSAANSIEVDEGDGQSATVGEEVDTPPSVIVMNGTTPESGVSVTFAVTNGGGSITGPATVTTGNDGIAVVGGWTLGTTAGANTLTATSGTISGSPVTFTATGTAGPAIEIIKVAGDNPQQSATVGTAVATRPSVKVIDEYDNPVMGQTVIFSTNSGSALVSGGTQTTDSDGIATVGGWTLGTVTALNELTATAGSLSAIFIAEATASTAAPTISAIDPPQGLNTGTLSGVVITGNHFSTTGGSVSLTKSGEENITGTCSRSVTSITCSFPLLDKEDGTWSVVVVNDDGKSVTKSGGFTIYSESSSDVSITSVSPASAMAGDNVDFIITGSDFVTSMDYEVYLYNSEYDYNITAEDVVAKSTTKIEGTFDLDNDADPDTYQLCIRNDFDSIECKKKAFTITTNKEGTLEIDSSPSGATIYIDNVANGTTPKDVTILVGSYKITLKKAGYQDWSKTVNVEEDEEKEVDATLWIAATATPTPARTTAERTATPTTRRTTVKSTIKIPTTWVDPVTTAPESPVEPVLIIGSLCLAFLALRRY